MSEKNAKDVVFIPLANSKCNTCAHLVSHAKTFHDSCHFKNGNDHCPAKTVQLGVGVNVEKASQGIADALFNKDVQTLQRLVNKLAGYKPAQTEHVLELVFNKFALHHGLVIEDSDGEEDGEDDDVDDEVGTTGGVASDAGITVVSTPVVTSKPTDNVTDVEAKPATTENDDEWEEEKAD